MYEKILLPLLATAKTDLLYGSPMELLKWNLKEVLAQANSGAERALGRSLFLCSRLREDGRVLVLWVSGIWQGLDGFVQDQVLEAILEMHRRFYGWYFSDTIKASIYVILLGRGRKILGSTTGYRRIQR